MTRREYGIPQTRFAHDVVQVNGYESFVARLFIKGAKFGRVLDVDISFGNRNNCRANQPRRGR